MSLTRRSALAGGAAVLALEGCAGSQNLFTDESNLIDVAAAAGSSKGMLRFGAMEFPCMVGRSGIVHPKHEGDGGTPAGTYPLREVRFRKDVYGEKGPPSVLVKFPIDINDAWSDDPEDTNYNRVVRGPNYPFDAEPLWRKDGAYDALAVIGYNDAPPVPAAGSAIFLHIMRMNGDTPLPTTGCVSLARENLVAVLAAVNFSTVIRMRTI